MSEATEKTVISGVVETSEFSARLSAKAFDLFSDKIYSNKPRAVIRELSCNAFDSHVQASKRDVPIRVGLPNYLDPNFRVIDDGVGLDHDEVQNVFRWYFESTKQQCNMTTGSMGLGSKSPFAYAKSYTFIARKHGIKRFYAVYKNDEGIPSVSLMSQEETDEPNGVEVVVPVLSKDFDIFRKEAESVFMHFEVEPTVFGNQKYKKTVEPRQFENEMLYIKNKESYSETLVPMAIMANVAYPIEIDAMKTINDRNVDEAKLKEIIRFIENTPGLRLRFANGEIDYAPSREHLSYDPNTINSIFNKIELATKKIISSIVDKVKVAKSPFEAHQIVANARMIPTLERLVKDGIQQIGEVGEVMKFEIGGTIIDLADLIKTSAKANSYRFRSKVKSDSEVVLGMQSTPLQTISYASTKFNPNDCSYKGVGSSFNSPYLSKEVEEGYNTVYLEFDIRFGTKFVIDDVGSGVVKRALFNLHSDKNEYFEVVIFRSAFQTKDAVAKAAKIFVSIFEKEKIPYILASTMKEPPASAKKSKSSIKIGLMTKSATGHWSKSYEEGVVDFEEGGYYCEWKQNSIIHDREKTSDVVNLHDFSWNVNNLLQLVGLSDVNEIALVRGERLGRFKKSDKWHNLLDVIDAFIRKSGVDDFVSVIQFAKGNLHHSAYDPIACSVLKDLVSRIEENDRPMPISKDSDLFAFASKIADAKKKIPFNMSQRDVDCLSILHCFNNLLIDSTGKWIANRYFAKYPLLTKIKKLALPLNSTSANKDLEELYHYVNYKDSLK